MNRDEYYCQADDEGARAHSDAMCGFLRQDEESKLEDLIRCVHWYECSQSDIKLKKTKLLQAAEEYVNVVKAGKLTK